jgi:hypothetical protein
MPGILLSQSQRSAMRPETCRTAEPDKVAWIKNVARSCQAWWSANWVVRGLDHQGTAGLVLGLDAIMGFQVSCPRASR